MNKTLLKVVKNELKSEKRILPKQEPKPLNPPVFEEELVDMRNPGIKWYFSLKRFDSFNR
jgi:hypothetical protein